MLKGFTENYYVWTHHGENCQYDEGEASGSHHEMEHEPHGDYSCNVPMDQYHDPNADFNMLPNDATFQEKDDAVFQALEAANQPLYEGVLKEFLNCTWRQR